MSIDKKAGKEKPEANIEDLDVREVSIVDKPAIRRKFLVVKNADGAMGIIRQEDQAMPNENVAEDLDILDLINIDKTDQDDTDTPDTDEGETQPNTVIDQLMRVVKALKAEKGETTSEETVDAICTITDSLGCDPVDVVATAKLAPKDLEEKITKALGELMVIVNKAEESDEDITDEASQQIVEIVSDLVPLVKDQQEQETDTADQEEDQEDPPDDGIATVVKVFVAGDEEDPEVILKAGAKMKQTRLSAFKKAVELLNSVLKDIIGEQANDDGDKKKKTKTKKSDKEEQNMSKENKPEDDKPEVAVTKEQFDNLTKQITDLTTKVDEMSSGMQEKVESLTKRVDELDSTTPDGEGGDDPEQGEETKKRFWGGKIVP